MFSRIRIPSPGLTFAVAAGLPVVERLHSSESIESYILEVTFLETDGVHRKLHILYYTMTQDTVTRHCRELC